jgi:hypothetical protein
VLSYRFGVALWLVLTLVDRAVYRHILALDGADARVVRLALLFLLQAIWLPIYLSRKRSGAIRKPSFGGSVW